MNGNGNPNRSAIGWLKGRIRPEAQATECLHLVMHQNIGVTQVQMEARIAAPTGEKAKEIILNLDGPPSLELACHSPKMLGALRAEANLPPPLNQQYLVVRISLAVCRLCPFFERPQ